MASNWFWSDDMSGLQLNRRSFLRDAGCGFGATTTILLTENPVGGGNGRTHVIVCI
jgi:hypothetical protein